MPKTTFLPIFFIILNIFVFSKSAYCQEETQEETGNRNYSFSFGTQFGFAHGQAFEIVYPVPGDTKGELLSELIWDMKPIFYLGAQFDFERVDIMSAHGFFTSLSAKFGIPSDSGVMEDRDWMSKENDSLTHFSSSTNKTKEFILMDLYVGASFPIKSILYIKPFFSGSWMHFSFTARDGYHEYPPGYVTPTGKGTFSGNIISYQQDWLFLATGFFIGTKILYPFSFDISFQISPLTFCATTDDHILRNIIFKDFTGFGLFLEPGVSVSFAIEKIELSLDFVYRYIGRTRGVSYVNEDNEGYRSSINDAGAGLSVIDLSFFVRLSIESTLKKTQSFDGAINR